MSNPLFLWIIFAFLILFCLGLDLGILNRRVHAPAWREALLWCCLWVGLALLFNLGIWWRLGRDPAVLFFTAYLVEESLSLDNLFVFLVIFNYFQVPAANRPRLLLWGILGAIAFRALFIAAGVTLIHRCHWIIYAFGAFLVLTGVQLARKPERNFEPDQNPVVRLARRILPVTPGYQGGKYFLRQGGRLWATPLFIAFLLLPTTDILFAVDSIPAVLAVTSDPFLVYTSNIFAVLGLRAFFFVLAGFMQRFRYLNYGLAAILVFVGCKMLVSDAFRIPAGMALAVVATLLAAAIAASLRRPAAPQKR